MLIHAALLTAVHPQLEPVVTAMLPVVPVAGDDTVVGETLNVQLFAPCVTVIDCCGLAAGPPSEAPGAAPPPQAASAVTRISPDIAPRMGATCSSA